MLGPLEVVTDGSARVPARQLRVLLAALLVKPRSPVAPEALIEAMWAGRRSLDASPTLRRHIARARAEFGVEIEATSAGYRIVADDRDVDGAQLITAVRNARQGVAGETLRGALRLWRSAPFPELIDWGPGRLAAAALAEARIEGLELLVRSELDRAAPSAELIAELRSIVDEHQYREAFWVLLVLALYRSGRQSEALEAVQTARRALAEDLGVLPGPELVAIERAVLEHASEIRLPVAHSLLLPLPLRLRPEVTPLVGRAEPLRALLRAWERVQLDHAGVLAVVEGEAGVGKSRLASEFAAAVSDGGGHVTFGRCERHGVAPFEPLAGVLRDLLRTGSTPPPPLRPTLASLLGDLVGPLSPHAHPPDAATLADAVASWLADLALQRPFVIVVDDLHWLSPSGALLLRALVERVISGAPILLLALARSEAAGSLDYLIERCDTHIGLEPLTDGQLRELAVSLGIDPAADVTELRHATGGVPLLLELFSPLGQGRARTLSHRVSELGAVASALLQVASLEPGEFHLDVVAAAANVHRTAALDALDRAAGAHVVDEVGIGRYRFRHAIIQGAVADSLSATRRAGHHLRLAEATLQFNPHALGRRAHHLDLAGPDHAAAAVDALLQAGRRSVDQGAAHEALSFVERAAHRIASLPNERQPPFNVTLLDCRIVRARALALIGDPAWRSAALDAAERADRMGDVDRLVDAALVTQRILGADGLRRTDLRRIALLQRALARLESAFDPRRAMVAAALADALRDSDDHRTAELLRTGVVSLAGGDGLPARQRAQLLIRVSGLFDGHGATATRIAAASGLADLHAQHPFDVSVRQMAAYANVLAAAASADGAALQRWLGVLALGIGEPEAPLAPWSVPLCRSWWALANGYIEHAESYAAEARAAGERIGLADAAAIHAAQTFAIAYERQPGTLTRRRWAQARSEAGLGAGSGAYDVLLLADEEPSAARALLDVGVAEQFADAERAAERLTALYAYVLAAARLDHADAAAALYRLLSPACGSMISTSISLCPSVDFACAQCALTSQAWDRVAEHLDAAEVLHRRLGASRFVAETALLRGESALYGAGDPALARALAVDVVHYATRRHLQRLADRGNALAARLAQLR